MKIANVRNPAIKVLILVLVLSVSLTALPQKANAFLVLSGPSLGETDFAYNPEKIFLCVLLLPLCVLNDSADITQVSSQDLLDNGYTQSQISNIIVGQNEVADYMKANNMNAASQLPQAVQAIKATLNDDYLGFVGISH